MTAYDVEIEIPPGCHLDRAGETVTVSVDEDTPILAAAREAEVWLPAFCQQGWCTTCAASVREGEVDHAAAKRYYDVDAEAGFALTCVATPTADCRLLACQEDAMREHRDDNGLPP